MMSPKLLFAAAFFLLLAAPGRAQAQACDPPGAAHLAGLTTDEMITETQAQISTLQTTLSQLLTQGFNQVTGNIEGLTTAIGKLLDAQTDEQQRIGRQGVEAQVAREFTPAPTACQAATGSLGASAANVMAGQTTRQLTTTRLTYNAGNDGSTAQQRISKTYSDRVSRYAGPREKGAGLAPGPLPDADITPGTTILSVSTYATPQQYQAAVDAGRNLTNPLPDSDFAMKSLKTPGGQELYLKNLGQLSKTQFAQYIIDERIGERNADPNDPNTAIWAQQILGAANIATLDPIPANISLHQLFETDVQRRYFNPQWYASLENIEPAARIKEELSMQAHANAIAWANHNLLEEIAVSLAILVGQSEGKDRQNMNVNSPINVAN